MIPLLARLAAADGLAEQQPVATRRDRDLLSWNRVAAQVARHCRNRRAAAAVEAQLPYADAATIELARTLADELRPLAAAGKWPPLSDQSAVLDRLDEPPPRRLEGPDLVGVMRLAEDLDQLRQWLLGGRDAMPTWGEAAAQSSEFAGLAGELRRCLDRDGNLVDGASPVLARLRRAAREREQQVRQSVARALAEANRRGWTTAAEATLRGDRFCLPLNAAARRKLPGIVHDRSQTGQTVYVEPAETVQLANDLAETRLEVGAEEARILLDLNRRVSAAVPALQEASELFLLVDRVRAAMQWSEKRRAQRPLLAPRAALRICRGRHPLLEEALGEGAVVPLDLELPPDTRVLVISGPNAGGKSVALKTVGVLVMLAQCGWDVPAREDTRLPLARRLFVDLGDEQSIEDSLSSFSAHLGHLRRFLAEADEHSLLLCDEIGSGTDPQEGTALALTALSRLAERGSLVLASTHFGLLKAAVHDHPAMVNAAMDYDEGSLAPLFSLRLGNPGASHAFDIAARVGLDPGLLAQARSLVGEERYQLERLLEDLARRARDLAAQDVESKQLVDGLRRRQTELDDRLAGLQRELKSERERVRRDGDELLREIRRRFEEAVREIRGSGGDRAVVQSARDRMRELAARLPADEPAVGPPPELQPGDRVRVPHLGLQGRVVEIRGDKVGVLADGMRLSVDRETLVPIEGDDSAPGAPRESAVGWTWPADDPGIPPELDLRGLRAEEAWERLDRMIDRSLPVGLSELTIVHGMGPGRLRDQLLARLAADPRVAGFHPGGERQSNPGATVIRLR
ncbi:MAG TPA: Smr/MutS family protein [Candidatus Krumholzibacteria bacterium]|nr:Smr/MutS family protein [Candidatus Krumholzibacteria bacterium]HPD71101.1 Smr/MutS family protein [Candidatus Krumholzibacteria bacterium]HRY39199.1 Smr/MutS family protein [Candidatus Krumholzibacteria bacterium]